MSMLAIWTRELSVLAQDSCGAKTVLGYFHCIWYRFWIIGQLFKGGVILLCSSLMTSIIIMAPFMRAVGAWGIHYFASIAEITVCVMNVVVQNLSSIPALMTHMETRPGWIDLHS